MLVTWAGSLFLPTILLTDNSKYTMPIMVGLLRGDIYKTEHGAMQGADLLPPGQLQGDIVQRAQGGPGGNHRQGPSPPSWR